MPRASPPEGVDEVVDHLDAGRRARELQCVGVWNGVQNTGGVRAATPTHGARGAHLAAARVQPSDGEPRDAEGGAEVDAEVVAAVDVRMQWTYA